MDIKPLMPTGQSPPGRGKRLTTAHLGFIVAGALAMILSGPSASGVQCVERQGPPISPATDAAGAGAGSLSRRRQQPRASPPSTEDMPVVPGEPWTDTAGGAAVKEQIAAPATSLPAAAEWGRPGSSRAARGGEGSVQRSTDCKEQRPVPRDRAPELG